MNVNIDKVGVSQGDFELSASSLGVLELQGGYQLFTVQCFDPGSNCIAVNYSFLEALSFSSLYTYVYCPHVSLSLQLINNIYELNN